MTYSAILLIFHTKILCKENWKYFLVGHGFLILLEKMLDTSEKIKFKFPWKCIKNKMLEGINFPKLKKTFLNIAWNTSKSLNWFSKATSKKGFSFKLIKYKLFKFHFPLSTWLFLCKALLLAVQLDQEEEKWNSFATRSCLRDLRKFFIE